jgi:predicted DNA-binding protein
MAEQLRRTMTFRLDDRTRTHIQLISRLGGGSASRVVREAIEAHVARMTGDGSGGGELQGGR